MHISVGYMSRVGLLGQRVHIDYFGSLETNFPKCSHQFTFPKGAPDSCQHLGVFGVFYFFPFFFFLAAYYSDFIFSVVIFFLNYFFLSI